MAFGEGAAKALIDEEKLGEQVAQNISHFFNLLHQLLQEKKLKITIEVENKPQV